MEKTEYEKHISDWSSDVCSSDLGRPRPEPSATSDDNIQEKTRMIIDCHAHLVPPGLLEAIRSKAANFPSVRLIEEGGSLAFSFAGGKPTRPVSKPLGEIGSASCRERVVKYV